MTQLLRRDVTEVSAAVEKLQRRRIRLGRRDLTLSILTPVALLFLWQIAADNEWIDVRIFSSPMNIFERASEMLLDGSLTDHLGATLFRLILGFITGAAAGILVGLTMGLFRVPRAAFGPTFTALYALPMIAILPILLLIFGLTETPRVLAVAISVFFVLQINTMAGIQQIDSRILEAAHAYNARGFNLFRTVLLPASTPTIATGLRIAAGVSVTVVTAVEFVAADNGLGYLIWNSWQLFQPSTMYVGLICVALLGAILTGILVYLERRVAPWRNEGQ